MDMMVEMTDPKEQRSLVESLTGPYRTMGDKIRPEDVDAPAWWHGDEEAFELSELAVTRLPSRR
jgi:hypothetical protein